jgi:hypothetical protein
MHPLRFAVGGRRRAVAEPLQWTAPERVPALGLPAPIRRLVASLRADPVTSSGRSPPTP